MMPFAQFERQRPAFIAQIGGHRGITIELLVDPADALFHGFGVVQRGEIALPGP